jgi:hypothetical protein
MSKNLVKLLVIFISITFIFFSFAVYKDISINKLSNYTFKPENITYSDSKNINNDSIEYVINFTSTDNFLGAINLPIEELGSQSGEVIFRISDGQTNNIIHENSYDFNFFNNLNNYIFGFPVINDSKLKDYRITLVFIGESNKSIGTIITASDINQLKAKYVFPRNVLLGNPLKLLEIVKNRSIDSAMDMNYFQIFLTVIFLSLIFLLLSSLELFNDTEKSEVGILKFVLYLLNPRYIWYVFVLPLILLIAIPVVLLTHNFDLAEKLANYVWVMLFFGLCWATISLNFVTWYKIIIKLLNNIQNKVTPILSITLTKRYFIFFVILLIFASGFNKTYYLGGDDTRLFYLYPQKYLENFASKIVSDTSPSSLSAIAPQIASPFVVLMFLLKKIIGTLNLQSILYTANIIGGIFSFYFLIKEIIPARKKEFNIIYIICSVFYVFSTFNVYILYNARLITIYLISIFPLVIYLFLKAVREKNPILLLILAVASSIIGMFFLLAPWSYAAILSLIPLIFYLLRNLKIRVLKYSFLLCILLFILNFHWIVYLPYSSIFNKSQGITNNSIVSSNFRKENENGIRTVAEINSVFYPLMNTYPKAIQKNFNWAYYKIFLSWSNKILPFNLLFMAIILVTGTTFKKKNSFLPLYAWSLLSFLIAIYFFTVNITSFGTNIFVWLTDTIPGFVMFRNMYDKFAYAVALNFSILLAISLNSIISVIKNTRAIRYVLTSVALLVLINSKPFLLGEYMKLPIWTTNNTFDSITSFNDDFINMTEYIQNVKNPGKYLILPMSIGNAFPIQDKFLKNHYYNGVSPLLMFSGKNDFSGLMSFGDYSNEVMKTLKEKNYPRLGEILKQFNVKYIIVNHSISDELANSFVFSDGIFKLQNTEMIGSIIGEKIKDFGKEYSLYGINSKYNSEKIYLTNNNENIPYDFDQLKYNKVDSYLYNIEIVDFSDSKNLIFLDPFQNGWQLLDADSRKNIDAVHFVTLGYANGWKINDDKNLTNKHLLLYFKPQDYYWPANIVTILGYSFCIIFIIYYTLKILKNEK